jgi:hypothetical protein
MSIEAVYVYRKDQNFLTLQHSYHTNINTNFNFQIQLFFSFFNKMAAIYTVLYPKTDKEFDLKYYLESHMKLVETSMIKYGLIDCEDH